MKRVFGVGDSILIRTVTMYQVGKVTSVTKDAITLTDASWVGDVGRLSMALSTGALSEVEKAPDWIYVNRGSVVDVFPWKHPLPSASK